MTEPNQRDIELDGRKITVHVLRVRDSGKVSRLQEAAAATPVDDVNVQSLREMYYPYFAASSEGDVPSEEEFLEMPLTVANKWFDVVEELNPGLLPKPVASEEEEKAKKGN